MNLKLMQFLSCQNVDTLEDFRLKEEKYWNYILKKDPKLYNNYFSDTYCENYEKAFTKILFKQKQFKQLYDLGYEFSISIDNANFNPPKLFLTIKHA